MKHVLRWLLLALACFASLNPAIQAWGQERMPTRPMRPSAEDPSNARVIVKYRANSLLRQALSERAGKTTAVAPQHASILAQRLNLPLRDGRILGAHTQALQGTGLSSTQLAAKLAAMPDVEWAVADQRRYAHALPNDPYLPDGQTITPKVGQWYLRAPDTTLVSAINFVAAWNISPGSNAVTVAVLDTGVRFEHPELRDKLYAGYDFIADTPTANDGDGRDGSASDPGDFTTYGECGIRVPGENSSWHGTQVAGLIGAATNNQLGMAGSGGNVKLLPVRVLGRCGGWDSDIIAGMRWAAGLSTDPTIPANNNPAQVLNLSLGSTGKCDENPLYAEAIADIRAKGATVVVSAGNDNGLATNLPANCPGVIAVAGLRHAGSKVGYSSIGPEVTLSAPAGNCVNLSGDCLYPMLTTSNDGATVPGNSIFSGSANPSLGTSFSAPLVSGTVGLMLSLHPGMAPDDVIAALQKSARPFPNTGTDTKVLACQAPSQIEQGECYCTRTTCGAGMLDAAGAVALASPTPLAAFVADSALSPGQLVLNAASSIAPVNRTLVAWQWRVLSGQEFASFSGSTTAAQATLVVQSAGTVQVQLMVTDNLGGTGTSTQTLAVAPAPVNAGSGGGGGGGGSMNWAWLLGLLAASGLLWRIRWISRR